jgi:hypothetical protein
MVHFVVDADIQHNHAFGVPYLDAPPKVQQHNQEVVHSSSVSVLTIFFMKKLTEYVFQLPPTSVNATPTSAPDTPSSPLTLAGKRQAPIASQETVKKQRLQASPYDST